MSKLEPIKFESILTIPKVPIQWLSKIELYYPDLLGFPIVYVHIIYNNKVRIYGFPALLLPTNIESHYCDLNVIFLCNKNLNQNSQFKEQIINELKNRFGLSNTVTIDDIISSPIDPNDVQYSKFLEELWNTYCRPSMGESLPYGKLYEELFSIVRFVSAWFPKTGRQSEMRMLYNFLSLYGEKIDIEGNWTFLDFFLLPTYDEFLKNSMNDFPKFQSLFRLVQKMYKLCFDKCTLLESGIKIFSIPEGKGWGQNMEQFKNKINPLEISKEEKKDIEGLVNVFNRHPGRTTYFISSLMLALQKDYRDWDKKLFIEFSTMKDGGKKGKGSGISEKVIACVIQQGFGNQEVIPIDTWVKSFHTFVLGIQSKEEFLRRFSKMGKLERMIWAISQGRKTNILRFFNILWCIRYGTTGNTELRGANPLSCYRCFINTICPGYNLTKTEKKVYIAIEKDGIIKERKPKPKKLKGKNETTNETPPEKKPNKPKYILDDDKIRMSAEKTDCSFICLINDKIPKKVLAKRKKEWILIDQFSGIGLSDQKTNSKEIDVTIQDFIRSLPTYTPDSKARYDLAGDEE